MKLTKCENGHFYDGDKYPQCPYCNTDLQKNTGVVVTEGGAAAAPAPAASAAGAPAGPVTGWMVVLCGKNQGGDYRLGEGRTSFGMTPDGLASLSADAPLSQRAFAVVYDAETGRFTALPGDGQELCYLNDAALLTAAELCPGDTLRLGDTVMQFVPFCGEFRWPAPAVPAPQKAPVKKPAGKAAAAKTEKPKAEKPREKPKKEDDPKEEAAPDGAAKDASSPSAPAAKK